MSTNPGEEPQNTGPHKPLQGPRDIRLVRVIPNSDDPHGFELRLSTTSLDDPVPYTALSYTWEAAELDRATGKVSRVQEFFVPCHGSSVKVTENLYEFLQRVRRRRGDGAEETYYWIDQVCINQGDFVERGRQVAMMGRIYRAARRVHIWLGRSEPGEVVMWVFEEFIPSVLKLESELGGRGISLGANSWDCSTPEMIEGLGAEVCTRWRENYEDFFWFFYTKRWFLRAWIFQEVTLKDVSLVHVSCGEQDFEWETFDAFARFVERSSWHHSLPHIYMPWSERLVGPMLPLLNLLKGRRYIDMQTRGGTELENWKANFIWDIGPQDERQFWYSILLHFLRTTRFMSAKNPKDHVYSLLGMMEEFLPPGMECPITPDYDAPTVRVFQDVATQIFQNTPSLYLLSTVSYGFNMNEIINAGDRPDWPSWVPDFSNETAFAPSLSTTVYAVTNGTTRYNAAKLEKIPYVPPTVLNGVLTVHGTQIGIIEKRNDRHRVISGSENLPFLTFILELCATRGAETYPNSSQTWLEAIRRTAMVDCMPPSWNPADVPIHFRTWLLAHLVRALKFRGKENPTAPYEETQARVISLLQRVEEDTYLSTHLPTLSEVVAQVTSPEGVDRDAVETHPFELLPCESWSAGRWYVTSGGYLGSGPVSLVPGDGVWVLKGAKMPVILRRVEGRRFLLVGESYFHGAMYGEMVREEGGEEWEPVDII